jgi:dienelactone hydrolase
LGLRQTNKQNMAEAAQEEASSTSCCPADSWPTLKTDGVRAGKVIDLGHGMTQSYAVGDADTCNGRAIIMLHDVWGMDSGRQKAMCDQFAAEGYLVVMPDMYRGVPLDSISNLKAFASKFPISTVQDDIFNCVIPHLQKQGVTSIGMIGFCWGPWAIMKLCADDRAVDVVKIGVNCHPSFKLEELVWDRDPVDMARHILVPQLLLSAKNDADYVQTGGAVDAIMKELKDIGKDCRVHSFPDMSHGWVNRGDLTDANVMRDFKKAMGIASAAWKAHL